MPCAGEGTCHPRDHPPEMASCGGSSRGEGEGRRGGGLGEGCASAPPACAGSEGPGRSGFPRSPSRSGSQGERRQARASRGRTCCPAQPSSASCTSTAGSGTRSSPETREPLVELQRKTFRSSPRCEGPEGQRQFVGSYRRTIPRDTVFAVCSLSCHLYKESDTITSRIQMLPVCCTLCEGRTVESTR